MDLTPEALHAAEFRAARRGGYNTEDVDDFIDRVAQGVEELHERLALAREKAEAAESKAAELARRLAEAESQAAEAAGAEESLRRTLVLAQRTADAAIREAEEQASRTLAATQEQANRMLAEAQGAAAQARQHAEVEARRAQEEARARVLQELRVLEAARDQLKEDVETLDRYLDDQRARLRGAVSHLQRLVDDPGALGKMPTPSLHDVQVPAPPGWDDTLEERAERPLLADPDPEAQPGPGQERAAPAQGWRPPAPDNRGPGPTTQPVDVVRELDVGDEEFLAELRQAMVEDAPLGPRDEGTRLEVLEPEADRPPRSRFGRRQ